MITIKEEKPQKLSGITSLFISFNYNQDVINAIKSSDKYSYNTKTYEWEVPLTSLSYILDKLTYIDDIKLTLLKDDEKSEYLKPTIDYKIKPFKHQIDGIEWALNIKKGLLLDAPGAGKTTQMIYLAEELKKQKGLEHCLIICGINSLKSNWKKEIAKFSNLSCRILGERTNKKGKVCYASVKDRAAELMQSLKDFFIITNVETIRNDDILQALKTTKNKIDMIVFDEFHACKSSSSQQGHNILKLTDYAYMMGLTGTLIMNKPLDAYVALKWIGVEKANLTNFKSQYCVFGGFGGHQIIAYKNLDLLKNEIQTCSLRRTKDQFGDLPPKTVINEIVEMDDTNKKFYENIKNGVKDECDKIVLNAQNTLALTTRLRQATACPTILTTENIISSKIQRAVQLVEEITDNGDKVIIMSMFKQPIYELEKLLKDYNPLVGTGDIPDDIVSKNNDLFQNDPKYKVFLGTIKKIGTGLTFNAANYAIFIDTPWTAAIQEQAEDRIHRIGSTKPVFIYRLICKDTIDEIVEQLIETKQAVSDFMIDDMVDDETMKKLSKYIQDL